jgi:threonine dehydrogenase-like Zn-dependent dehydrogenase
MHVQRAIELPDGPELIVATEISDDRLAAMRESFADLAEAHGRQLLFFNPQNADRSLYDLVMQHTDEVGADDVVVCVPVAGLMAEAATLMNPDGMLVLFAGVPKGTYAPVDMSAVYLNNAQYTGTSGLTMADQAQVMNRASEGVLSPARAVAAIGGMQVAVKGLEALIEGRYPGKIIIFPQIDDLPLMGLDELKDRLPEVAEKLGPGDVWTKEAEEALIEAYWQPEEGK